MERTTTWESLKGFAPKEMGKAEILCKDAGIDYDVTSMDIMRADGVLIPDKVALVRSSDNKTLAVNSSKYNIIKHPDAFSIIDDIDGFNVKKIGDTANGTGYIIGTFGDDVSILGDKFTPYIIARNSFDGSSGIQAAICPLRIVCQNQLNVAFKEAKNTINIKHTYSATARLEEAREVMKTASTYINTLNEKANEFAGVKVTESEFNTLVNALFPMTDDMSDRIKTNITEKVNLFRNAYFAEDNRAFKGTLWGCVNAYSDYITHSPIKRKTSTAVENKFMAVTFNPVAMAELLRMAKSIVAAA